MEYEGAAGEVFERMRPVRYELDWLLEAEKRS